ncbi:hypothetical protein Taro_053729 [Colocasia esculenta]|uniref:Uncharacterized protein n=1 Tax=Colocasia esculenta TaxID=4460 RepID=A0A843XNF2_COLES|nr:hypothetical protein [Colocasia esculenta]
MKRVAMYPQSRVWEAEMKPAKCPAERFLLGQENAYPPAAAVWAWAANDRSLPACPSLSLSLSLCDAMLTANCVETKAKPWQQGTVPVA